MLVPSSALTESVASFFEFPFVAASWLPSLQEDPSGSCFGPSGCCLELAGGGDERRSSIPPCISATSSSSHTSMLVLSWAFAEVVPFFGLSSVGDVSFSMASTDMWRSRAGIRVVQRNDFLPARRRNRVDDYPNMSPHLASCSSRRVDLPLGLPTLAPQRKQCRDPMVSLVCPMLSGEMVP